MQIGLHSTEQDVIPTSAIIAFLIIRFLFRAIWWNRSMMFMCEGAVSKAVPTGHIFVSTPAELATGAAR